MPLSDAVKAALAELFNVFDVSKTGYITVEDMKALDQAMNNGDDTEVYHPPNKQRALGMQKCPLSCNGSEPSCAADVRL